MQYHSKLLLYHPVQPYHNNSSHNSMVQKHNFLLISRMSFLKDLLHYKNQLWISIKNCHFYLVFFFTKTWFFFFLVEIDTKVCYSITLCWWFMFKSMKFAVLSLNQILGFIPFVNWGQFHTNLVIDYVLIHRFRPLDSTLRLNLSLIPSNTHRFDFVHA